MHPTQLTEIILHAIEHQLGIGGEPMPGLQIIATKALALTQQFPTDVPDSEILAFMRAHPALAGTLATYLAQKNTAADTEHITELRSLISKL